MLPTALHISLMKFSTVHGSLLNMAKGIQFGLGTCESFFSFESNWPFHSFSNRIFESNRQYSMQAVTQPNGLQAYRTACYTYSEYLIHRYFVFVTNESDVWTTELQAE